MDGWFKHIRRRWLKYPLALCLAGGGTFAAMAADTPPLYGTDWGLTLKADGTGFYNDLLRLILPPGDTGLRYDILPYRRAMRRFVDHPEACLYPSNLDFLVKSGLVDNRDQYLAGSPVLTARLHLFSGPGQAPVSDYAALKGKTLAYAMGASTPFLLRGHGAFFIAVADEVDKAQLVLSGRVDLMAAALPDAWFVFKSLKVAPPPYAPDFALDISDLGIVCHKTADNQLFLNRLSRHVQGLTSDGRLAAFYRSQGLDPLLLIPGP